MSGRYWLLVALAFVLATAVNYAVFAANVRAINDRISLDRHDLGLPVVGMPTPAPVTFKCTPNCAADKKVLDALLSVSSQSDRWVVADISQASTDLTIVGSNAYASEAIIVLIAIIVAIRIRTSATTGREVLK